MGVLKSVTYGCPEESMNRKIIKFAFLGIFFTTVFFLLLKKDFFLSEGQIGDKTSYIETKKSGNSNCLEDSCLELENAIKQNIDNPTKNEQKNSLPLANKTLKEEEAATKIKDYIGKNNEFNFGIAKESIAQKDFQKVIDSLSEDNSETSMIKKQQLEEDLNGIEGLLNRDYDYSCGKGVCAIRISYIENETVDKLTKSVLPNLRKGVSLVKNTELEYGYKEIRILFNSDETTGSMLTVAPGEF